MKRSLSMVLTALLLVGCATADRGQISDLVTTDIALNRGFVEGNPFLNSLGMGGMAVVKIGVTQAFKFLPEPICSSGLWGLTIGGYGGALWNIGVMLGSGPAAIPVFLGLTWWQWDKWYESSANTCADPWHVEPITLWNNYGN